MNKRILACGLAAMTLATGAQAATGKTPTGIPELDHVFVIMMENHAYGQIAGNPDTPFINSLIEKYNSATNYYGVAHPSSQNYLDIVGGSNFNNLSDQYPDWHNTTCKPNIATGITNVDVAQTSFPSVVGPVCPIAGTGTDATIPALDETDNEGTPPLANLDGTKSIPADTNIVGKSIADQLVNAGKSWKSYQQDLPLIGADGVNVSDGTYIIGGNNAAGTAVSTDFSTLTTTGNPVSASDVVYLYAVKHNPFAYFASVQEGANPALSLSHIVGFDGQKGLYADLKAGTVPNLSFIAPSQCNDQHGRGNGTAFCEYDADDNGTTAGLNPSLILQGDQSVERIVTAIKASPAWTSGKNAIVLVWDENDYSTSTSNRVVLVVNNNYGPKGIKSATYYNHYSLTKTLDSAFRLPCLNHACDAGVEVLHDLFKE